MNQMLYQEGDESYLMERYIKLNSCILNVYSPNDDIGKRGYGRKLFSLKAAFLVLYWGGFQYTKGGGREKGVCGEKL